MSPFLWNFGMNLANLSLIKNLYIKNIMSAIREDINKYNVNMAAFDQTFKQQIKAKIGIMKFIILFLFYDKFESFRLYLILKNEYALITIANIIPKIRYSSK